ATRSPSLSLPGALPISSRIVETAWLAVEETENQLDELTQAQVVDAGATGLLLVFDALRATIRNEFLDPEILESIHGFHVAHPHRSEEHTSELQSRFDLV